MIKIGKICLGSVQTNCYFLYQKNEQTSNDDKNGKTKAIVFDPADLGEYLYQQLDKAGFQVEAIMLTHGHFDHIFGVEKLRDLSGAKVYASEAEKQLLADAELNCSRQVGRRCVIQADEYLKDGSELEIAGIHIKMILTPGHTEGSCCYYVEEAGFLICGDTLFTESVGRTDLPTGSGSQLVRSIREKLFVLPEDTICYPGHGDSTTIGNEQKYNPYCC